MSREIFGISSIISHYEACLDRHGPTHLGADWPNAEDLNTRYSIMLGVTETGSPKKGSNRTRILDLGCGPGLLLDYLDAREISDSIDYLGIDKSEKMVDVARARWPDRSFDCRDIFNDPLPPESVDYVVMNGVLTEKISLTQDEMTKFACRLIIEAFKTARMGIAFNVMSCQVDWRRDDLFHWAFDEVAAFLTSEVSRNYIFRADYGLYEYTTYVYREAGK